MSANFGEHLGLLDRIDAEIGFEVQVEVEHVGRIVGLLGDNPDHLFLDVIHSRSGGNGNRFRCCLRCRWCRLWRWRRRRFRNDCGCGFGTHGYRGRGPHRWSLVPDAQSALLDFEIGMIVAAQAVEPRLPAGSIGNTVVETELIGVTPTAIRRRHPSNQGHRQLGTEAGPQTQRILHRVAAARRQVQFSEFGIDFLEVRHGRDDAGFERLDGDDVFDARAHGVTREALRIGDDDLVSLVAKDGSQCVDFGGRAAATRRCVGLVRHEHGLRCNMLTGDPVFLFRTRNQVLHDAGDVIDIEPRAVERAVGRNRTEYLGNRLQSSRARCIGALYDERSGAHARDHAVTAAIERRGCILRVLVGRRGARRQEARAYPFHHVVRGHIVCGHDDDALAAATPDPVFRQCHGLSGAGARAVDLGIRPARADLLGELRVTHREDAEQEAPVEVEAGLSDQALDFSDAPVDFLDGGTIAVAKVGEPLPQAFEAFELFEMAALLVVAVEFFTERIVAGECRGKDDAGVITQRIGQPPALGQLAACRRRLVTEHQRNAGISQCVEADGNRHGRRRIECLGTFRLDAELVGNVELAGPATELHNVFRIVDGNECRVAVFGFDEACDVFLRHRLAETVGYDVDELFTMQYPADVFVVEYPLRARQAERCTADHDGLGRARGIARQHLLAAFHELVEQLPELICRVVGRRGGGRYRCRLDVGRRHGHGLRHFAAGAMTRRVQSAERLVERRHRTGLRMVDEQRHDIALVAQHAVDEAFQRLLGADFDEYADARVVQFFQPVYELDG